ncbi:unnamed protein product [Durusdinium trenchii]|uniref:Uncharacterized protein n=1 Tax=Durusdinium trenchii TaxID=1381693 RepID=A0ABP0LZG5_9DINO
MVSECCSPRLEKSTKFTKPIGRLTFRIVRRYRVVLPTSANETLGVLDLDKDETHQNEANGCVGGTHAPTRSVLAGNSSDFPCIFPSMMRLQVVWVQDQG